MKRTDMEKKEREMKRARKKLSRISTKDGDIGVQETTSEEMSVSFAMATLFGLLQFDPEEVYNIVGNEVILEHLMFMQESFDEKQMHNIMKKTIKKTKVVQKEKAFKQMLGLLD